MNLSVYSNSLRIAVVGSGAIGSYHGAKLVYGGSDVHFLMRGDLSECRRRVYMFAAKVKISELRA